jgi:tol-pal system protein YbgF
MKILSFKKALAVAVLSSIAIVAFAEEAPVYDADNFPPSFDGQPDIGNGPAPASDQPVVISGTQPQAFPQQRLSSEQRINRLEQQMNNMQQSNSSSKMSALQNDVQTLRGQVEDLTHQLQQAQAQQKAMYADLDKRVSKPSQPAVAMAPNTTDDEVTPPAATKKAKKAVEPDSEVADAPDTAAATLDSATETPTAKPAKVAKVADVSAGAVSQPNVAEEQQIYQTAYDLIKAKKYNEAIAALQKMLQKYPSGQFAANAHYWLGELNGLLGKNDQSAVEFSTVVSRYPDSPKVSDAQLKLGLIFAAQFKWTDAKSAFKKVINHYPGSASARLASEQLKQIKAAGH